MLIGILVEIYSWNFFCPGASSHPKELHAFFVYAKINEPLIFFKKETNN
jgi:hypothetical protein